MKKFGLILLFCAAAVITYALINNPSPTAPTPDSANAVEWVSIQEAEQLVKKKGNKDKKLLVDLYTDWCGWCKKMDANTFTNPEVAAYLKENYIAVKLNAESKNTITFNGKTYDFVAQGRRGTNMIAVELGAVNGRIGYPTLVFLDESLQKIQAIPGYQTPDALLPMLHYFAEDHYLSTPWEQYKQTFNEMKGGDFVD